MTIKERAERIWEMRFSHKDRKAHIDFIESELRAVRDEAYDRAAEVADEAYQKKVREAEIERGLIFSKDLEREARAILPIASRIRALKETKA